MIIPGDLQNVFRLLLKVNKAISPVSLEYILTRYAIRDYRTDAGREHRKNICMFNGSQALSDQRDSDGNPRYLCPLKTSVYLMDIRRLEGHGGLRHYSWNDREDVLRQAAQEPHR